MATCKTIVLAQPEGGNSVNYEIPTDETGQLTFGPEQISGLKLNDFGGLEITFQDGGSVTLTNFSELADNGNLLYLADGTLVDPALVSGALNGTGDAGESSGDILTIVGPAENVTREITLEPGQKYVLDFDFAQPQNAEVQDGNLVISFANDGVLVLNGYEEATAGDLPAELTLASSDTIISGEELLTSLQLAETAPQDDDLFGEEEAIEETNQRSEVQTAELETGDDVGAQGETDLAYNAAAVEPASGTNEDLDAVAEALQEIAPAAGEAAGSSGRGYGFNSRPGSEPLGSIDDVGPINPTQLQYEAPEFTPERLDVDEQGGNQGPINGTPGADPLSAQLDETNLGPQSVSDTVPFSFGSDGAGVICLTGVDASGSLLAGDLTSGGQEIFTTVINDGAAVEGRLADNTLIFDITIDKETGEYTFTQYGPLDHDDATNPDDIIDLEFGVVVEDSDGDQATTTITISIADDAPLAVAPDENTRDESALTTGDIVINDVLLTPSGDPIDFGEDGPGSVEPTGTPATVNGVTNLTSGGQDITITPTPDGYIGTLPGGATAFELTVDPADGSYTYTQSVPFDHNPANDTISIDFPITIADFDGDTVETTITVNLTDSTPKFENDTPKIGDGLEIVDETDLPGVNVSGQLSVDFGADVPGAVDPVDGSFVSSGSRLNDALTSGGQPVTVRLDGDTFIGETPDGSDIFTLLVNPDGSYEFNLIGTLDHADPNDPNDIIDLTFGVVATDGDGDTAETTIVIKVKDDVPVIGDSQGDVDETNLDLGPISTSDIIFTSAGAEIGSVAPDSNIVAKVNGNPIALTSGLSPVSFEQTADGYRGTINGGTETVFEISVAQDGTYTYTQFAPFDHPDGTDANDIIDLEFGFALTSVDGDSDNGTITISVADDGPVANDDVTGSEEGQVITGDVTANDDFSQDVDNTVTQIEFNGTPYTIVPGIPAEIDTPLGKLTIGSDGQYTFETVDGTDPDGTLEFIYTLVDGDGDSDTAKLNIRVTPDGQPIAVTETMTVDETNLSPGPLVINETLSVDFGLDGAGTINPNGTTDVSGSVAGVTLTSGGVEVVIRDTADGYEGVLVGTNTQVFELIVQDNGDYSFELFKTLDHADATDPNDLIKLEFGITVADADGDTADGTITINVLDDAPVALDDGNAVLENQTTTDGNVTDNDIEGEDAPSAVTSITFGTTTLDVIEGTPTSITGDHGTLVINADGSYEYTSFGTNVNTVTDEFTYTLTDFDGDSDTAELSITIKDVNTKPTLTSSAVTVDDTDLPDDMDNGQLVADFGADGPGTFEIDTSNPVTGATLTSNGLAVAIAVTATGVVGTVNAGADTVFELTLNPETGEYEVTLFDSIDHPDTADANDALQIQIPVNAVDSDGDKGPGTITVTFLDDGPQANDDFNAYDTTDGKAEGNVITGENGGAGAADDLSNDNGPTEGSDHDVVEVSFTDSDGNTTTVSVPAGGSETIEGEFGFLTIADDGSYTYELKPGVSAPGSETNSLDPNSGDVVGTQTSFTKNGITVTSTNGQDLSWWNGTGPGVGVGADAKVWPDGDGLDVDFNLANAVEFKIGDIGVNNLFSDLRFDITFEDGSIETVIFDIATTTPVDGIVTVSFDSADYGGKLIDSVELPWYHSSFVLSDVTVTHPGEECFLDEFEYVLQDGDGDQSTATLTLKGKDMTNDVPVIVEPITEVVDETDFDNGPIIETGTVTANFFGEGPGTIEGADTFAFMGSAKTEDGQLLSNGVKVDVNFENGTYTGTAGTETIFTLTIEEGGDYTFELLGTLDHADENNPDDAIDLKFGVKATDKDGDMDTADITVTVKDDGPYIRERFRQVDETDLENGPLVVESDLPFDFGQDGAGEVKSNGDFRGVYQVNGPAATLLHKGVDVDVQKDGNGYIGKAGDIVVFTLEIDNQTGDFKYTQYETLDHPRTSDPDDIIWLKFGVDVVDADGDTVTSYIGIDVHDDGPVANNDTNSVTETDGSTDGDVLANDDIGADQPGSVTKISFGDQDVVLTNSVAVITGAYGELTINEDGSYIYQLTDGNVPNTAQEVFTYMMRDGDGDPDTATLTIDIEGFNDHPTIGNSVFPVAEADLADGPVMVMRSLDFDFGQDGPGELSLNGDFMLLGSSSVDELKSNGQDIDVEFDGNVATGTAEDGRVVFTLELDADTGKHTFTLFEPVDHGNPDAIGAADVAWIKFGVDISDADGDTKTGMIQVDIRDDGPYIRERFRQVDETDLENGPLVVESDLPFDFGQDGAGTVTSNNDFRAVFQVDGPAATLRSGGVDVDVTKDGDGYIGKAGDTVIFTLEIDNQTGDFKYTQYEAVDHPRTSDPDDIIWLKFGVDVVDADGDTVTSYIGIDVHDDGPSARERFRQVDETDFKDVDELVVESEFPFDYGEDGPGAVTANGDFRGVYQVNGPAATLLHKGVDVDVQKDGNGYIGLAGSVVVFTLTIDNQTGDFKYTQYETLDHPRTSDPDDIIWLKFGVDVVDADGDTVTSYIGIDVHDDGPVANTDVNVFDAAMATGNVLSGTNGGDNSADYLSQDDPTLVTKISYDGNDVLVGNGGATINGQFGALEIDADGDYKYTLFDQPADNGEKETVYNFNIDNPPGSDAAGDIENVNVSYNEDQGVLTFSTTVTDYADGFTVAINDGPNPKGIDNELALFYFDRSGPDGEPVVTAYNYNGQNTQTSWTGNEIATSASANSPFSNITLVTDSDGTRTFSFTVDANFIQDFYPNDPDWVGVDVADKIGIWLHPVDQLNASYDEDGYLTEWDPGEVGWYDSANEHTEVTEECPCHKDFEPDAHDISHGIQTVTLDGVTVSVGEPQFDHLSKGDLVWVTTSDVGNGIGINGNGSNKVWSPGETLEARLDDAAQTVTVDFADIGENDNMDGLDFLVYVEGQSEPIAWEFDIGDVTPVNGEISVVLDSADFGGLITGFDVFSISNSELHNTSFLLNSIHADCPPEVVAGTDIFEYMITDSDGDPSSAYLVFNRGNGDAINGTEVAETLTGTSLDDVIYGAGGDDVLTGGEGADVFLFLSDEGTASITDFDLNEGDTIDLSQLLEEYDPVTDAINDFVFVSDNGTDTTIAVDADGLGAGSAQNVATLEGVTLDLNDIIAQNSLVA